jgi:hypothetical protein
LLERQAARNQRLALHHNLSKANITAHAGDDGYLNKARPDNHNTNQPRRIAA